MTLMKAMATVGGFTMLSRIAGLFRDILLASFLATGPIADAFIVALRLPNFFRSVTAEGAFSVSFVPLYSKTITQDGDAAAAKFAGQAASVMVLVLAVFTALMMLAMPLLIRLIAPGFDPDGYTYALAVDLTRITFPYLIFMSLTALFGGMLNANKRLGPFAVAPIFFNLCQIGVMLFGLRFFPTIGHALSWAVSFSGVLQVGMMLFFLRRYKIKFSFQLFEISEKIKILFSLMLPAVIGAGIYQINLFADLIIASMVGDGAISYLYYADRLNQLPIGLIGAAVSTALLPMLSRAMASGDVVEARGLFNRSLEYCLILTLPIACALMVIADRFIATVFQHGEFTASDTYLTSTVLACYAVGLPAYITAKVYQAVFWSQQDTRTPVKISIITACCNIFFSLLFSQFMGVAGIALSTGGVAWVQFFLLRRAVQGDEVARVDAALKRNVLKVVLSSVVMMLVLGFGSYMLSGFFEQAIPHKIAGLVILVLCGAMSYGVLIMAMGVVRLSDIKSLFKLKK